MTNQMGENMNCYKKLMNYIDTQYKKCDRLAILNRNSLDLAFEPFLELTDDESFSLALKREANIFKQNKYIEEINRIVESFKESKIEYILLKGISLAKLLYDNMSDRIIGDIDIYVGEEGLSAAIGVLESIGYIVSKANGEKSSHHITLNKDKTEIELHRNILNPKLNISESYLKTSPMLVSVGEEKYRTMNYTVSLLHMLYHIYMHYHDAFEYYSISKTFICGCPTRNDDKLYRYFELALFIEKYSDKICWADIADDIAKQNLSGNFREMVFEISYIFDGIFPEIFLNVIKKKIFTETCLERDLPEYLHISHEMKTFDPNKILSRFISNYQEPYMDKKIHNNIKEFFDADSIYINMHVNENKEFVFLITIPKMILKSKFQKIIINYIVFSNDNQYLYNSIEQHFLPDYIVVYQDWFQNGTNLQIPVHTDVVEGPDVLKIRTTVKAHNIINVYENSFFNLIIKFVDDGTSKEIYTLSKRVFDLFDPRGFIKVNKNGHKNIPCRHEIVNEK